MDTKVIVVREPLGDLLSPFIRIVVACKHVITKPLGRKCFRALNGICAFLQEGRTILADDRQTTAEFKWVCNYVGFNSLKLVKGCSGRYSYRPLVNEYL